jgi:hypothetical protein
VGVGVWVWGVGVCGCGVCAVYVAFRKEKKLIIERRISIGSGKE